MMVTRRMEQKIRWQRKYKSTSKIKGEKKWLNKWWEAKGGDITYKWKRNVYVALWWWRDEEEGCSCGETKGQSEFGEGRGKGEENGEERIKMKRIVIFPRNQTQHTHPDDRRLPRPLSTTSPAPFNDFFPNSSLFFFPPFNSLNSDFPSSAQFPIFSWFRFLLCVLSIPVVPRQWAVRLPQRTVSDPKNAERGKGTDVLSTVGLCVTLARIMVFILCEPGDVPKSDAIAYKNGVCDNHLQCPRADTLLDRTKFNWPLFHWFFCLRFWGLLLDVKESVLRQKSRNVVEAVCAVRSPEKNESNNGTCHYLLQAHGFVNSGLPLLNIANLKATVSTILSLPDCRNW